MNQGNQKESRHPVRQSRLRAALVLILVALAGATPLCAQLSRGYTLPGSPTLLRDSPNKEDFQKKLQESQWKTGALHLSPWLGLRDASFVNLLNNQGETGEEDFTLTVGAGLRGYLPVGSKFLLAAHALPEYVWWTDNEAKRRLNGRYGLGLFFFFNRMTVELSHRRVEQQEFFSSEIQALTSSRSGVSTFDLDLEITPNLSLVGLVTEDDYLSLEDDNVFFSALDRIEDTREIGLQYGNRRGLTLAISHVDRSIDFKPGARPLSSSGTSEVATIALDRPRSGFRLIVAANDREGDEGSVFGSFDQTTGSFDVFWRPRRSLAVLGYTRREQDYAVDDRYSLIVSDRSGARLDFTLKHATLGVYAEVGEDEYPTTSIDVPGRLDDVTAYGAALWIELDEVGLRLHVNRTVYDSTLSGFARDVTQVSFAVDLALFTRATNRLVEKLSLGNSQSDW